MLVIRFSRVGRRNKAQFRIVVQEHKLAPKGKHIEIVGNWDPHQKKGDFNADRIKYWLGEGAQASDSVHNLLVAQGIIEDKKRPIKISKKKANDDEAKEGDGKDDGNDGNDSASAEKDANAKEEGSEKNESNEENAENKDDKKDDDSEGNGDK